MKTNRAKSNRVGISEAAKLLGVSRSSAYILMRSGEIPGAEFVADIVWLAPRRRVMSLARKLGVVAA
jgi:hypothetical protein